MAETRDSRNDPAGLGAPVPSGPPPPPSWSTPAPPPRWDEKDSGKEGAAAPGHPSPPAGQPAAGAPASPPHAHNSQPSAAAPFAAPLPPAGGRRNWAGYSTGRTRNYRQYRSGYPYRGQGLSWNAPMTAGQWVRVVFGGALTLGVLWLISAFLSWQGWARSRGSGLRPLVMRWKIQASVLSALTALAAVLWVAGIVGSATNSQAGADLPALPATTHASFGQTVTVVAPVGGTKDANAKVRVTVSNYEHNSTTAALPAGDTASALVRACAVDTPVDPSAVAFILYLDTLDGGFGSTDIPAGGPFSYLAPVLRAHQCATGVLPFRIPASSVITSVNFGFEPLVQWPVPQSSGTSTAP